MSAGKSRRLLIVWVLLAALAGAIVVLQSRDHHEDDGHGHVRENRDLLPIPVAELSAIEIATDGQLHRFERDTEGRWFYHGAHGLDATGHEHTTDPALAERMANAFNALDKARMEREAPLDQANDSFGVTVPNMILIIYKRGESQPFGQYAVGDMAPDDLVRYVHLVGTNRVVTLPQYHIDNLRGVVQTATAAVPLVLPAPAK
ncbi:MAG: hypothetical protein FJY37_09590 [Betaproteobacteria bacterium]|nr:hypothetical protein [Betaproteobacteria bacterium]